MEPSERLMKAFESYKERFESFNPTEKWVSDTKSLVEFSAKGMKLTGSIELRPRDIDLELKVPMVFRVFRKKALKIIEDEIRSWIVKARNGELSAD